MSIASEKTHVTLEELLASPEAGRFEIVRGQLEEVHVSSLSSNVAMSLGALLVVFCRRHKLGEVFDAESYYRCFPKDPTRARKPDISFVSQARLPANWMTQGFFEIPPDLVVEVISPNDTAYEVAKKLRDYHEAGVRLIWEVNPEDRSVMVHRIDGSVQKFIEHDRFSGEDILPGFECQVADFLPPKP